MYRRTRVQAAVLIGVVVIATLLNGCSADDASPPATTPAATMSQAPTAAASPHEDAEALARAEQLRKVLDDSPVETSAVQSHAWNDFTVQVSVTADAAAQRMKLCAYLLEKFRDNINVKQILIPVASGSGTPKTLVRWDFPDENCRQDPA